MPGALCVEGSALWQFSCVCRVVCIAGSESFLGVVLVVVLQHVGCHENTTQHKQQQGTDDRNSGGAGRHTNTPTHTDQPHKTQHKQPGTHQQSQGPDWGTHMLHHLRHTAQQTRERANEERLKHPPHTTNCCTETPNGLPMLAKVRPSVGSRYLRPLNRTPQHRCCHG